jgi:conjugative transfer signal peptidase TraF
MIQSGRSDRFRWVAAIFAASLLPVAFAFCAAEKLGLRFNTSPSLPIGIYIVTPEETNLVEFCPAEPSASFAIARGYRSPGNCQDGGTPLMKPVVARAGDQVELTEHGITVNETFLLNSAPRASDSAHRPLVHWPFGIFSVASGRLWVASTYNPRSYDSRYFGPVPVSSVRDHLRPLWIWK